MFIRTISDDIVPKGLSCTHCHEHLFVFPIENVLLPERLILNDYQKIRDEIVRFKELGGNAIVDVQPFGAGRHAVLLEQLSHETGLWIIASTGLHKTMFYQPNFWAYSASISELADLFISELEEGMYAYDYHDPFQRKSELRAGMIKIATEKDGLTAYYKKVFEAASIAHKETGAPIITHTELSTWGVEQVQYLLEHGVSNESIIISHMDRVIDINNNIKIAELGVFLEYDTIARYTYHSDDEEALLLKKMGEMGFSSQILIGMDSTRERLKAYGGPIGLDYSLQTFIPLLRKKGIDENYIKQITIKNPQRALTFKNK